MKRQPNGTIELTLTIPWADVAAGYEKAVLATVASAELPGFRKGKAPRASVEAKLDKNQVYSQVIQDLLPAKYAAAVKEHNIKPILYPQLHMEAGKEGQDWTFTASTCEAPEIKLPQDWQAEVKKLTIKKDDDKLAVIVAHLLKIAPVAVPDLLVEEEANHRLSGLAENLSQLGLTTQQYLNSKKLTPETLKAQNSTQARQDLSAELVLSSVQSEAKLDSRPKTLEFLKSLL